MLRLRKLANGSYSLNQVTPAPSGLSHAGDLETAILTLSAEDAASVAKDYADGTAALPDPVSDTSKSEGLSNAKVEAAPVTEQPVTTEPPATITEPTTAPPVTTEPPVAPVTE